MKRARIQINEREILALRICVETVRGLLVIVSANPDGAVAREIRDAEHAEDAPNIFAEDAPGIIKAARDAMTKIETATGVQFS